MSEFVHIGTLDEFVPNEPELVTVDNREICVVRTDDGIHALGNRCPHMGGPLHHGEVNKEISEDVEGTSSGQRPELVHTETDVITCPWHGWEFEVDCGVHAGDPSEGVPTFDVHVDGDDVHLDL